MQVTVENLGKLKRKLTISIPPEAVQNKFQQRLEKLGKEVKLDGFRPGKVPAALIKQRFSGHVLGEVLEETIGSSYSEALAKEKLQPISHPKIEPIAPYKENEPFQYVAIIEISPEITLADFGSIQVEKTVVQVTDKDVDNMLENIRKQFATWNKTEDGAKDDDRLIIDYQGMINGKVFKDGEAKNAEIILGSKRIFPNFAKNFYGAKAGSKLQFKVAYPNDYPQAELAGNEAEFTAEIKEVTRPELSPIDDKFAEKLGIKEGGVSALRAELKKNLERETTQASYRNFREAIFKELLDKNPLELPEILVAEEIKRLRQIEEENKERGVKYYKMKAEDFPKMSDEKIDKEARNNVTLSLLLSEIVKKLEIKLDQARVKAKLESLAGTYEKPEEALAFYQKNPQELQQVQLSVLEEQLVDTLQQHIKITEKQVSYSEQKNA